MNRDKRIAIFSALRERMPAPTTELEYESPFELLIAVILSAQATDVSVNKATAKLYPLANTPAALLELGVEGLKPYIKTIGLFNSKAENIIKTCRILLDEHNGEVPRTRAALEALHDQRERLQRHAHQRTAVRRANEQCHASRLLVDVEHRRHLGHTTRRQ